MADASTKRMMQGQPQRIVSGAAYEEDARIDVSVRPRRLEEYIGQKRVKENIQIAIDAARSRDEALDHVLLYGPPGLGKTTRFTVCSPRSRKSSIRQWKIFA